MGEQKRIAFFDVDETLIGCKSMFSFLAFWTALSGWSTSVYEHHVQRMADIARRETREASNRAFYEIFRGAREDDVAEAGRRWFTELAGAPEPLFNEAAVRALSGHRDRGDVTVLVSGSFGPCLEPVRRHVGADLHRGTELEVRDGRYTGDVAVSRIGGGKAAVVDEMCAEYDVDPADCFAYGDHPSDLQMLLRVGSPVVVGNDAELVGRAARPGWDRLPGPVAG